MNVRKACLGGTFAVSAVFALACAAPASAAVFIATSVGTINGGFDGQGLFGTPGADLTGLAYKVMQTIDTSLGTTFALPTGVFGGSSQGAILSMGPSTITVNGISKTVAGAVASEYFTESDSTVPSSDVQVRDLDLVYGPTTHTYDDISLGAFRDDLGTPTDVLAPLKGNYCPGTSSCGGAFDFFIVDNVTFVPTVLTYGGLSATSFTITAAGVPEPATWTMLLLGFGGLGGALRSSRRRAALCPA